MIVLETERLVLRRFSLDDAEFVLELLNQPSFIENIGDKGVRTLEDARLYITNGPIASYAKNGFGLNVVEYRQSGEPIGMCGLLRRDTLDAPDLGYAFLPQFWSKGFAVESARAVITDAVETHGLRRILAITNPDNVSSIRVLEKIGFEYERLMRIAAEASEVKLFAFEVSPVRHRDNEIGLRR